MPEECPTCHELFEDCECDEDFEDEDDEDKFVLGCDTQDCIFQGPHFLSECVTAQQMIEFHDESEAEGKVGPNS